MCIGGRQPEAPVNSPAYKPEDSYKHFETTKTDEDGKVTNLPKGTTSTPATSVPKVKASQGQIRM